MSTHIKDPQLYLNSGEVIISKIMLTIETADARRLDKMKQNQS